MDQSYFAVGVLFCFALLLGGGFLGLSALLGTKRRTKTKLMPYECGVDQASNPRHRYSVHFFLTAMLFLLFDVEVTFLIPWAVLFQDFTSMGLGRFILVEGLVFIGILGLGLIYVWRRGALEWEH
ncbi:MAG: NADH-quinone oxidoreductase subunit A [Deltaproteobacteria bacterium]|nr:NADH-quinone oxidoreductase subunit A [Deltaproteobacteria bacterium]